MPTRFLVNEDGSQFTADELSRLRAHLEALLEPDREEFRNANAKHIATHASSQMLIVSGPGTGKSMLFKQRIDHWLRAAPSATILALSFVRKLVADLANGIQGDSQLTEEQKKHIEIHTLHRYARSLVEKNNGTKRSPLKPHFRIIGGPWKEMVWEDALTRTGQPDGDEYSWDEFERQLHECTLNKSPEWQRASAAYSTLCRFYNAVGFADLIVRATIALHETPALEDHAFFIIDEYQDFNPAEEHFIKTLSRSNSSLLIVGDDDQVLYEQLKAGKAALIRSRYSDPTIANAMLPLCSRCGFHVAESADHFITKGTDAERIHKLLVPLRDSGKSTKVQVIACATPGTAVDYVRGFLQSHMSELEERRKNLANGTETDAFILILSPTRDVGFYREPAKELRNLIAQYQDVARAFTDDYFKVLTYFSAANRPEDNFLFRKVLWYANIPTEDVGRLIDLAIRENRYLCDVSDPIIADLRGKLEQLKHIVLSAESSGKKAADIDILIHLEHPDQFAHDLEEQPIGVSIAEAAGAKDEEDAELEELDIKRMSAVELMTIVGSKGLSADHVIVVGFDNVNMNYVTRNAFFVAMTRARHSLHLLTALRAGGAREPHVFLADLPDANLEFFSYKKGPPPELVRRANRAAFMKYLAQFDSFAKASPRKRA